MKTLRCLALLCLFAARARADGWMDQLEDSLRVSFFKGAAYARLSGLVDMEGYAVPQPAPGLIDTGRHFLFNPRFTLNLDVQLGRSLYVFAKFRVDRGFDPAERDLQARFDEYAISYKPWAEVPLRIQAGKFASVAGVYAERYESWTNPFITAPLPYENQTPLYDRETPPSAENFLEWRYEASGEYGRLPVEWGPNYTTGLALFGDIGPVSLAAEVKNASLSSPPGAWNIGSHGWQYPTWSGHASWRPNPAWRFGLSASIGPYLRPGAEVGESDEYETNSVLPPGKSIGDYKEEVLAQDITFEWRRWQFWSEFFETRFQVPRVGDADTFAYYLEGKYKFTPQLFGALRWNQQVFSSVRDEDGDSSPWGDDIWRIDAAVTYRFTPNLQAKAQYSYLRQSLPAREEENLAAFQLTLRF